MLERRVMKKEGNGAIDEMANSTGGFIG